MHESVGEQASILFKVSHIRHNRFSLNLGIIKAAVAEENYHRNLALQVGNYSGDNYAAESPVMLRVGSLLFRRRDKVFTDQSIKEYATSAS